MNEKVGFGPPSLYIYEQRSMRTPKGKASRCSSFAPTIDYGLLPPLGILYIRTTKYENFKRESQSLFILRSDNRLPVYCLRSAFFCLFVWHE